MLSCHSLSRSMKPDYNSIKSSLLTTPRLGGALEYLKLAKTLVHELHKLQVALNLQNPNVCKAMAPVAYALWARSQGREGARQVQVSLQPDIICCGIL